MKPLSFGGLTVILLSQLALTARANLLANPGFNSPVSPADWTLTGGATREQPYAVGFGNALVMREQYVPQNGWASGFQTVAASPWQRYTLAAQVVQTFQLHPEDYGMLEIIFLTSSGQQAGLVQSAHFGPDDLPQDRTWANVSISGQAPAGTAQVRFQASFFHGCPEPSAKIGFDNFVAEVQPVPEPYVAWCAAAIPVLAGAVHFRRKWNFRPKHNAAGAERVASGQAKSA